ncbi:zinc finger protein 839 isoform X2 [Choloepus didactylus]|uniref:zinc finger protein 839 isoform X2 n=1 Tax=Choloepus didactylus TaxID=27675 RepID=UPI0018A122F8|nr:zinc finger protein 839 isoform X2 [Choloepus didactylus]
MAGAEPEAEDSNEDGGPGRAPPGQSDRAARVAPLGPEQLRRVLEQVTKAQPPAVPPPPFVLQDAAQRLRDAAQQAALQLGPGADPPRRPRLLPPQQLEAICIKVTSGGTNGQERPLPPLVTIQPKTARPSLLPRRTCSLLGLRGASPQLLRVQPLLRPGPQQCFRSSSPQPPVQVLVHRPLPAFRPVSARRITAPKVPSGLGATPAPSPVSDPQARTAVSSGSADLFISSLHTEQTEKLKKSLKVKTRSGRISRPPKYKARDYKFIKTEDLADGHQSDSDDYSELSVEDEEDQREKLVLFDLSGCSLRPKTFKCQTCEKSYIGKGGLARHFKLNPGHGQLEPARSLTEKADGSMALGRLEEGPVSLSSPQSSTPATLSEEGALSQCATEAEATPGGLQNGQSMEVEEALVSEPENGSYSALWGLRRCPGLRRSGCSKVPAKSHAVILQPGGAAQPLADSGDSKEQSAGRGQASLTECLQQCDPEDLVELALPRLAQVVTVYEFLLMKVGKGRLAKPFFPAVYKEFEQLHKMVKQMCQDYLSGCGPCSQEPLEISNNKVAESLGITEEFLRRREMHPDCIPPQCSRLETHSGEQPEESSRQKRENEVTEEVPASVKRTRRETPPKDTAESVTVPLCVPVASEGVAPRVDGGPAHCAGESHAVAVSDGERSAVPAGQQLKAFANLEARTGSAGPAVLPQPVSGPALSTHSGQPGKLAQQWVAAFPEENAQEPSAEHNAWDRLSSSGLCSPAGSLLPSGAADPCGMHGPLHAQAPGPSTVSLADVVPPVLEDARSMDLGLQDCAHRAVSEPGPPLSTEGGLGSHVGDFPQFCRIEVSASQGELASTVAVGEAVAFEITSGCHGLLSQGQEHVFIQTSDGILLSHPGTVVSQEDIVIVTEVEPALQMGPPEGLPLETVEAEPAQ